MNIHIRRSNHICTCIMHMCIYKTRMCTNADIHMNTKMFPEHFKFYFDFLFSCYTFLFICMIIYLFSGFFEIAFYSICCSGSLSDLGLKDLPVSGMLGLNMYTSTSQSHINNKRKTNLQNCIKLA